MPRSLRFLLRLFLIALVLGGLVWLLRNEERFGERLLARAGELLSRSGLAWGLVGVTLFSFVNWGLEARKWQLLARPIVKLGYWDAYRGVLSGLALGLVTPHGLGDYLGRIGQLDHPERTRLIGGLLLSRISQLLVTALFGGAAWLVYWNQGLVDGSMIRPWVLLSVLGLLILMFLLRKRIARLRLPLRQYWEVVGQYSPRTVLEIHGLSLLRYAVFTGQFLALLLLCEAEPSVWVLLAGVALVFLAKSVLMSFNVLADLGLREAAALYFLGELAGVPADGVLLSTLGLWLINLVLPSLVGAFLLWRLRFTTSAS